MTLRQYLDTRGVSVAAFARRVPCNVNTIHQLCNARHEPLLGLALRIVELTDGHVQLSDLPYRPHRGADIVIPG